MGATTKSTKMKVVPSCTMLVLNMGQEVNMFGGSSTSRQESCTSARNRVTTAKIRMGMKSLLPLAGGLCRVIPQGVVLLPVAVFVFPHGQPMPAIAEVHTRAFQRAHGQDMLMQLGSAQSPR